MENKTITEETLSSEQTNKLFHRLNSVFDLPEEKLREIFLDSSDEEFQILKNSVLLLNSSVVNSNGVRNISRDEQRSFSGETMDERRSSLMEYIRPVLPTPVPLDHADRHNYINTVADVLYYALSHRDTTLLENIVHDCPDVLAQLDNRDKGRLLLNLQSCNTIEYLLKEGVDPNAMDKYGSTLLHKFVMDRDIDAVKLLIKYNADCNIEDKMNQRSALQLAALQGFFDAFYVMVTGSKVPVKIEKCDFDGNTLLHLALQSEYPNVEYKSMTMFLLDKGLSPSAKNLYGETPLHYFCVNRTLCSIPFIEPLFELLLEAIFTAKNGAKTVDLLDNEHCTPLIIACAYREWELCKILLRHGADMNIPCSMNSRLLTRGLDKSMKGVAVPEFESDCTTGDLMPRSVRQKIYPYISSAQSVIDPESRDRCMNCAAVFPSMNGPLSLFVAAPKCHCRNCGRVVCEECIVQSDLPFKELPEYLQSSSESKADIRVCVICHPILSKDLKIEKFW